MPGGHLRPPLCTTESTARTLNLGRFRDARRRLTCFALRRSGYRREGTLPAVAVSAVTAGFATERR
jgi:hypothetical protein